MSNLKIHGLLAEFADPHALINAAKAVRDAGYKTFDCHSPFPVHGMDQAMGMKRSSIGFIVAVFAFLGAVIGLGLQGWASTAAYPLVISGKPLFSWQAYIIITFALFVLFGAISAVLGMLRLNKLPRLHHPVFYSDCFKSASDDGFFVSIEASDTQFDAALTKTFLESIGGKNVEVLEGE